MPLTWRALIAGCAAIGATSCGGPSNEQVFHGAAPSPDTFPPVSAAIEVRCGTLDCHGSSARNLRIYGIDGLRLEPTGTTGDQSTTSEEVLATYDSIILLQPEVLSKIVSEGGRGPERWLPISKGREREAHEGGRRMVAGDDTDTCLTSWMAGATDSVRCENAANLTSPDTTGGAL